MRILDKANLHVSMENLGFRTAALQSFLKMLRQSHGLVLVTGPTGSGKTTTLYSALDLVRSPEFNIITVEDPVEYQLWGIGQIQVNPKIGLTFAHGLRSVLRHDPDVILVGEIRDVETAEIAIQSALTGHLVFSTLHTNDAASAVTRLVDMGVEPFLVASVARAIVAQRLIRVICPECKEGYVPEAEALREGGLAMSQLEGKTLYRGKGCPACSETGYRGRSGIYEILMVSEAIRQLIMKKADSTTIGRKAVEEGMRTLREDGARKVIAGITTLEEVVRVTQE
jgi:general secretion pathway protein E